MSRSLKCCDDQRFWFYFAATAACFDSVNQKNRTKTRLIKSFSKRIAPVGLNVDMHFYLISNFVLFVSLFVCLKLDCAAFTILSHLIVSTNKMISMYTTSKSQFCLSFAQQERNTSHISKLI